MQTIKNISLYLMAALYLIAGINHFISPDFYFKMIPDYLPYGMALVYISGVAEIVIALALVFPQTTKIAAWALIALLLAVFPANLYMAMNPEQWKIPVAVLYARLPLQLILVLWAWVFTRNSKNEQNNLSWKTRVVLLFAKLRKPIDPEKDHDIAALRRKSERAAKLGHMLFDNPVSVAEVSNESADGVPIRIYKNNMSGNQDVFIYFHGGGFVLYGLDSHDNVCRRHCSMNNCIVISVDYRLAPEHTFPAAHEDAFTALKWVKKNIANYGGNPEALIVAGDSAGGNIAACMAHRCKKEGIALKAQILVYPWIDGKLDNPSIHRNGKGFMLEEETMFWFQQQYTPNPDDHCNPKVSPCYESDFSGLAPAFILTAEYDPLLDDGFKYYNQLKEAGVKVKYKEYKGQIHGFINIPLIADTGIKAFYDIKNFIGGL